MTKKTRDNRILDKAVSFVEGSYFPLFIGAIVILCYVLELPLLALALLASIFMFICVFAEDTRPTLAIVLLLFLCIQYRHDIDVYKSAPAIFIYGIFGCGVLIAVVYRLLSVKITPHKRSLWISLVCLSLAFFLGGAGDALYDKRSFFLAAAYSAILLASYFFYAYTMKEKEDNLLYLARICAVAICVIALQIAWLYVTEYLGGEWSLDGVWKETGLQLGWGISNLIGEMTVMLLPAVFYLIYKEKHGYWYYLVVVVGCVATYFTLARGALLCGMVVVLAGLIVNAIFGKKWNILLAFFAAITLIGVAVIMRMKGKGTDFFLEVGLNDRGRFALWEWCIEAWKQSPVFGKGFSVFLQYSAQEKTLYSAHNTLIHMLSTCGIVGGVAYVAHRVHTFWLVLKSPTLDRLFMSACLLTGLVAALISPLFFRVYFLAFYVVILTVIEKSVESEKREKQLLKKTYKK